MVYRFFEPELQDSARHGAGQRCATAEPALGLSLGQVHRAFFPPRSPPAWGTPVGSHQARDAERGRAVRASCAEPCSPCRSLLPFTVASFVPNEGLSWADVLHMTPYGLVMASRCLVTPREDWITPVPTRGGHDGYLWPVSSRVLRAEAARWLRRVPDLGAITGYQPADWPSLFPPGMESDGRCRQRRAATLSRSAGNGPASTSGHLRRWSA